MLPDTSGQSPQSLMTDLGLLHLRQKASGLFFFRPEALLQSLMADSFWIESLQDDFLDDRLLSELYSEKHSKVLIIIHMDRYEYDFNPICSISQLGAIFPP